jgi:hypothetical protein
MAFPATVTDHTPVFGNGETLSPGVYNIGAAGSIAASLTLDGQGSSDAVFIFQFGGAFTTAASGTVILTNGAMAENVFWGANGAIPMATMTDMQGTLIANGAVSMGDGGTLVGRMLSTVEAVTVYNTIVTLPGFVLPIELLTFTGSCIGQHVVLNWTTASEQDNDYFTVERSLEGQHWQVVGTVDGAGSSTSQQNYTLTDMQPSLEAALYRLKQTDFNAIYQYGDIIVVEKCGEDAATAAVFPNPSNGHFILSFSGDPDEIFSIEVLNTEGQKVFGSAGMPSMMDLSGQAEGVYVVNVQLDSKTIHLKVVVEK